MAACAPVYCLVALVAGGCGSSTPAPSPDLAMSMSGGDMTVYSLCGHPGDTGNSKGVGRYCMTSPECSAGPMATVCSTLMTIPQGPIYFCTFPCDPTPPPDAVRRERDLHLPERRTTRTCAAASPTPAASGSSGRESRGTVLLPEFGGALCRACGRSVSQSNRAVTSSSEDRGRSEGGCSTAPFLLARTYPPSALKRGRGGRGFGGANVGGHRHRRLPSRNGDTGFAL